MDPSEASNTSPGQHEQDHLRRDLQPERQDRRADHPEDD